MELDRHSILQFKIKNRGEKKLSSQCGLFGQEEKMLESSR